MMQSGNSKEISLDNISENLDSSLSGADADRKVKLNELSRIKSIKAAQLQKEKERLSNKYGENDPRVQAINTKIEANNTLMKGIEITSSNAEVDTPEVDQNTYLLHGFVKDSSLNPISDITVAVYDSQNNWVKMIGYACTDSRGYFKLEFKYETAKRTNAAGLESFVAEAAQQTEYYIHLSDKKANEIYIDKRPLYPKLGQVDYRLIIISKEAAVCVPPEEQKKEKPIVKEKPNVKNSKARKTQKKKK